MARETSTKCYIEIRDNGLLSKIRLKVLESVLILAPCTSTELNNYMTSMHNINGSWKVLPYLRDVGVLYETGTRECKITGRKVIEWDLTDKLPRKKSVVKFTKPKNFNKSVDYILGYMEMYHLDYINIGKLKGLK